MPDAHVLDVVVGGFMFTLGVVLFWNRERFVEHTIRRQEEVFGGMSKPVQRAVTTRSTAIGAIAALVVGILLVASGLAGA